MSAVLGPIHELMYNKVIFQEKIIGEIVKLADEKSLAHTIKSKNGMPALEEVIDLSNIHGSLSGMIDETERRYAKLVSELLKADYNNISLIKKAVAAFGEKNAIEPQSSAETAYQRVGNLLLDGMPCDHSMRICENSGERVEVMRTLDTHSKYWEEAGLDGRIYYILRKALVKGLLSNSGFTCNEIEAGVFEIVAETLNHFWRIASD